jgi:hypothetical protein
VGLMQHALRIKQLQTVCNLFSYPSPSRFLALGLLTSIPKSFVRVYIMTEGANHFPGTSCGNSSSLACASGQCTSRDLQCKTIMGSYTQGNDTYACDSSNCQVTCASPEFPANVCYSLNQNFLDGTPCGGGGQCSNGVCQGSSVGGEISSWIQNNKTLVIALAAGIGGLLVLAILACCISRFTQRRRVKNISPPPSGWTRQPWQPPPPAWAENIPRPPLMRSTSRWGRTSYQAPPPPYFNGPSVRYA